MPFTVKKQEKESSQALVRRFGQKLQRSKILFGVRKGQFKTRGKSNQLKKRTALRRNQLKEKFKRIKKFGTAK